MELFCLFYLDWNLLGTAGVTPRPSSEATITACVKERSARVMAGISEQIHGRLRGRKQGCDPPPGSGFLPGAGRKRALLRGVLRQSGLLPPASPRGFRCLLYTLHVHKLLFLKSTVLLAAGTPGARVLDN